jgi:hypothetical protein
MKHRERKNSKKNTFLLEKVLILISTFFFSSCFNLFEKEEKTLAKIDLDKHNKIEANLISTGATTEDVIQIVFTKGNKSEIIKVFKSYNWVELIRIPNDSLLIKLSDSVSVKNYIDTQYIKLPN